MLRTSVFFFVLACIAFVFGDIEISTNNPWQEFGRMFQGALSPDLPFLYSIRFDLLNTLTFGFCGIAFGVVFGALLSLVFEIASVRFFCSFIRSIHEIFWAMLLMPALGLHPLCGILAIGIPYSGIIAKVYAEIHQEADLKPLRALPLGVHRVSAYFYAVLPIIARDLRQYSAYRLECALRSTTVLGFIGLPTLGYHLETAFRQGQYSQVSAILYIFYLLVFSLRYWVKAKLTPLYLLIAIVYISRSIDLNLDNLVRFFTYDILPWPLRRTGVLDGTLTVSWSLVGLGDWFWPILQTDIFKGTWNTLILTQIVLVGTGLTSLISFPWICRHFFSAAPRQVSSWVLIILRTTPEYILAYVFIQLWGPSMLPALAAIALHNGAILGFLNGQKANFITLKMDACKKKFNRYFYEILPRIYGQFLAFLFYRWEIMMRESAILGVLGIYTLGFYIDSAIQENKADKALLLILFTAALNFCIDQISQHIRRSLKISYKMNFKE